MKKMKKLFAILMTMAMVMGLSITGFAQKTGATINVTNLATTGTQKVDIYLIYQLDDNDNGWEVSDWATGVQNLSPETLDDADVLDDLKTAALKTTADETKETDNGSVTFNNNIQAGAYLVLATDEDNKTTYNTMVAVTYQYNETTNLIEAGTADVIAKADTYIFEKTVDADQTVVEVGDLVEYTITTVIPYYDKGNPITEFKITDTLTNATYYLEGAAVKGVNPVNTVTIGSETLAGGIPTTAIHEGNTSFTLDLFNYVKPDNTYAGQKVTITYTAKVNGQVDEVTNSAYPSNNPEAATNTGKTEIYTGKITITKYNEGRSEVLQGAEFVVYRMNGQSPEYATITNGYVTGWVDSKDDAGHITTGTDGTATLKGLDNEDTYYFEEVVAPDGYSLNTTDKPSVTITRTDNAGEVVYSGNASITDTTISALPETGGMGTTLFTIAGCVIMISAAGLFFATRKKAN